MPIKYDSQKRAVAKYNKDNYDVVQVRVPKGRREEIKAFAENHGESLNGFIVKLIDEAISSDNNAE